MEQQTEASILHHRQRRQDDGRPVNFSQIRRPCPLRTDLSDPVGAIYAQPTPPETPLSPQSFRSQNEQHTLFHNYLRAFCQFDPPTNIDENDEALLMTAPIQPGDLILVHSVHANGWADGTVLTTGARGWLPTNYCEKFDHPYMKDLLNAMTQFWDLLGVGEDANLSTFVRQDYIRGLIAGVRSLLEHAGCLHRETALVQRSTGIRRMRKGLLADLSTLVQIAKRLQDTIGEPFAGDVIHVLLDDLTAKAFRVVTRAVGFVDMLTQEAADAKHLHAETFHQQHPATPPVDDNGLAIDTGDLPSQEVSGPIDSAKHFPTTPSAPSDSMTATTKGHTLQQNEDRNELHSEVIRPPSALVTHRLSLVRKERTVGGTLASKQLGRAHDACISHIGAFIGLHLHSRPSSELVANSERLVNACKDMLAIVDQISTYNSQQSASVKYARMNFQLRLDELTMSTKDFFKFSDEQDDDVVMLPEQTNHLVNVGTSLIRTVGECVVKTRKVVEHVGDFELGDPLVDTEHTNEGQAVPGASPTEEKNSPTVVRTTAQNEKRSSRTLTPAPLRPRAMTTTNVTDFAQPSPATTADASRPEILHSAVPHSSMPLPLSGPEFRPSPTRTSGTDALKSPNSLRTSSTSPARKYSVGNSVAGSTDTHQSSMRDSANTAVSEVSTRVTTPDHNKESNSPDPGLLNSFGSLASLRSAAGTDASSIAEAQLLHKTYANELTLNKDSQVTGGSLPALVEQLTTGDTAPDAKFVAAFFVTFRTFTTPRELARALIYRFDYIGDSKAIGTPVRLRIYNAFKGWLETYWNAEGDKDALGDIRYFALHKLKPHLPPAGERLVDLTRRVAALYHTGTATGPLVSGVGKTSMSIGVQCELERNAPEPLISKNQLNTLRTAASGGPNCPVLDFDPLELARQLTILSSKIFCEIQPEELLSLDWNKKTTTKAKNVRSMCTLNTDLAHVVGDSVLTPDDAKKRAVVIKHWSKVAMRCLDLNNYESLMAIMCSLNSSVVQRLKRTWEVVSKKTRGRLDELNVVVDFSRNQASLRKRLETPVAPCLPFLGIYLTDLTFVDAGNPKMRELSGTASESGETISVINFDKQMRMARIISHVQKFQVPYRLKAVPEMQMWMQSYLERMREGDAHMVGNFHRRSLVLEPKRDYSNRPKMPDPGRRHTKPNGADERPKTAGSVKTAQSFKSHGQTFEFMLRTNLNFKGRQDFPPTSDVAEEK